MKPTSKRSRCLSKYVLVVPNPSGTHATLFNLRTGLAARVSWSVGKELAGGSVEAVAARFRPEESRRFFLQEFCIPSDLRETDDMLASLAAKRIDTKAVAVTFAPGMGCNMSCPYCFIAGSQHPPIADEPVMRSLKHWISQLIEATVPNRFRLAFYGGEPLLYIRHIRQLVSQATRSAHAIGASCDVYISTNGSLLTECDIRSVSALCDDLELQVTLDGPPAVHNARRPLRNGGDSFRSVLAGVRAAVRSTRLRVRVNVDVQNVASIPYLFDILVQEGICPPADVMLWPTQHTVVEQDHCKQYVGSYADSAVWLSGLWEEMATRGIRPYGKCPLPGLCMRMHAYSFAVGADGFIYRCTGEIGINEEPLGHVADERVGDVLGSVELFSLRDVCTECQFLAICAGGCTVQPRPQSTHADGGCELHTFYSMTYGPFLNARWGQE